MMKMRIIKILIIGLFLTSQVYSQSSLQNQMDSLKEQLRIDKSVLKINLSLCHEEFRSGTQINILGGILLTGGILLSTQNIDKSAPMALSIVGGILTIIGTVCWIDSHKYIGYVGEIK